MALTDILARIAADADREADAIVHAALEASALTTSAARADAEARSARALDLARERAEEDARTTLAQARIRSRDHSLSAKREMVDRVMAEALTRLEALPPEEYADLIAREVAGSIRGGEHLVLGEADRDLLASHLRAALATAGVNVEIAEAPGEFARGVVVEGARMRTEISPATIVATKEDALTTLVAEVLFGAESEGAGT